MFYERKSAGGCHKTYSSVVVMIDGSVHALADISGLSFVFLITFIFVYHQVSGRGYFTKTCRCKVFTPMWKSQTCIK